ncbi:hypothetical protein HK101_001808, partial [Irineochytrium annulatum]
TTTQFAKPDLRRSHHPAGRRRHVLIDLYLDFDPSSTMQRQIQLGARPRNRASTLGPLDGSSTGSSPAHATNMVGESTQLSDKIHSLISFDDVFWGGGSGEDPTQGVRVLHTLMSRHFLEVEEIIVAVKHRISLEEHYASRLHDFSKALTSFNLTAGMVGALAGTTTGFGGAVPYGNLSGIGPSGTAIASELDTEGYNNPEHHRRRSSADEVSTIDSSFSLHVGGGQAQSWAEKPGGGSTQRDESSLLPVTRNWGRQIGEMSAGTRRHVDTLMLAVVTPLQAFVAQHRRVMEKKKTEVDTNQKTVAKCYADIAAKRAAYISKARTAQSLDDQRPHPTGSDGAPAEITPMHLKARRDADAARAEYQQSITAAEHARSALEFHISDYLAWAQETEYYRLRVAREAFLALESSQLFTVEGFARLWTVDADPESVANGTASTGSVAASNASSDDPTGGLDRKLVTPSPSYGVENIAMRLRTGSRHSPAIVFDPTDNGSSPATSPTSGGSPGLPPGPAPRQAFGIPLETLAMATGDPIPALVRKCVAALYESQVKQRLRSGVDAWVRPNPDLPSVHFMRLEFNASLAGGRVTFSRLQRENPAVVAGVLKLFLIETPTSLCNYEIYDVLKIIYSTNDEGARTTTTEEETMVRLKSVSSLLATLNSAHYETLKVFAGLMHETVKSLDPTDKRIRRLAYTIAPCIIRPKAETSQTLSDTHPYLLTLDLLRHFESLFGGPIPVSYFEAPPTPPVSPEPEDEDVEEAPRGFRIKATSSLNLKEKSGVVSKGVGNAWRGLVKSVSTLNLRGGGGSVATAAAANAASLAPAGVKKEDGSGSPVTPVTGKDSPEQPPGGWFSWGKALGGSAISSAAASASAAVDRAAFARRLNSSTMEEDDGLDGDDLELDVEPDDHPCQWAGCSEVLGSPEALMEHLQGVHMKVGAAAGATGVAPAKSMVKRGRKRLSAAVLPVEMDLDAGGDTVGKVESIMEGDEVAAAAAEVEDMQKVEVIRSVTETVTMVEE